MPVSTSRPDSSCAQPVSDCGRAALRRVLFIHECLGNEHRETARSLAEKLETSERTIKRDLEFMRDQLGAPIEWDGAARSYVYSRPCDILPLLRLSADEALALVLASQTFAAWRGTPIGRALTAALRKIAGVVGGAVSVPVSEIAGLIFQPDDNSAARAEHRYFAVALEAIQRRRELRIIYHKPHGPAQPKPRVIQPLHLAFLDHRWMLIAYDPARRAPRNFLLSRFRDAERTGATFVPPKDFDIAAYLRGSLGRFTGEEEHEVRIAFDRQVAPYIREKPWHASQLVAERGDGSVEVTLRLNNLTDVRRAVLACGAHAEVLAPVELREAIEAEARAMLARYASTSYPRSADDQPITAPLAAAEAPESYSPRHSVAHPVK